LGSIQLPKTITVARYLVDRLAEIGIRHLFGVPGDFNLVFLDTVVAHPEVAWIGNANELNAAYAADGYARCRGAAALLTTFGVGELSALNGLAGSYAEYLPVLQIVGAPPSASRDRRELLHHTLGDGQFDHFSRMHAEVTVAQAYLTAENAAAEIDRVIAEMLLQRRPAYIVLPADMVNAPVVMSGPLRLTEPLCDEGQLAAFLSHARRLLAGSFSAAVLADFFVERFGAQEALRTLIARGDLPYATTLPGKSMLDDMSANFLGTYIGAASDPGVSEMIEQAGTLIAAGLLLTDVSTAGFSHWIRTERLIDLQPFNASVAGREYRNVPLRSALLGLSDIAADLPRGSWRIPPSTPAPEADESAMLTQDVFLDRVQQFLQPNDILVVDVGTAFFGMGSKRLPPNVKFIGQPLWASIGYALPAAFGAATAFPKRRVIILVGDGSALMTVQEIGTMLRDGLKPIIILINNDGYTIERAIHGSEQPYNDIPRWDWQALLGTLGPGSRTLTLKAETPGELKSAFASAEKANALVMLEAVLPKHDVPEMLVRITRALEKAKEKVYSRGNPVSLEPLADGVEDLFR
jgi:indolepyruvate decarboxylase